LLLLLLRLLLFDFSTDGEVHNETLHHGI